MCYLHCYIVKKILKHLFVLAKIRERINEMHFLLTFYEGDPMLASNFNVFCRRHITNKVCSQSRNTYEHKCIAVDINSQRR